MELENLKSTDESLNAEEGNVAELLATLPRVETPGDFDVQVRRRIANGAPADTSRIGWILALKFALPVLVLLGLGTFIIFLGNSDVNQVSVPPVVDGAGSLPAHLINSEVALTDGSNSQLSDGNDISERIERQPLEVDPQFVVPVDQASPQGGGFEDRAGNPPDDPILPKGLNPKMKSENPGDVSPNNSQLAVRDILQVAGISCDFGNAVCQVRSVSANSIAARAGVKTGDVIDAIDDKAINGQTVFRGTFSGKSLRITRDGKRFQLDLAGK